ncbi:MAG: hypothetical protein HY901_23120 [Deltaproteobacteria bacterium]|nr:hypothetical protein [Deltaproteobacteria bacterium]
MPPLIHCQRCGRPLEAGELKYAVRMDICADFDGHLQARQSALGVGEGEPSLEEALTRASAFSEEELMAGVHQELAFLVCPSCRAALLRDPLGAGFLRGGGGMVQ